MASPRVIVIGGGVAGLTVAHELADRGFAVEVYEARAEPGGKARSQPVRGSGTAGRLDLPGEHGFRFYPRFYRHVIDQMARIPAGGRTVADALKPTTEAAIARIDDDTWYRFSRKKLTTPYSVLETLEVFFQDLDFDAQDIGVFGAKLLQFATASDARRLAEYEKLSWWDFLEARHCSEKFQSQLRGIPRMMVAMDSMRGSARTIGVITLQLLRDFAFVGMQNDRTLGGPTTRMWIEPWLAHLRGQGVELHAGMPIAGIEVEGGRIGGVLLRTGERVTGDFYVLAVPLEAAIALITPELGALDPQLELLRVQSPDSLLSWMSGIQFYLYEDVPLVRGHIFFPDSPWALTAVSQPQFWRDLGVFRRVFGDGSVGGLISVDISEWSTPGKLGGKPAKECTRQEIADEVWWQLKAALNGAGEGDTVLTDELLHSWHLDDDLDIAPGSTTTNSSRLLVHPPGSWLLRPEAATAIPNLALAGDYVRTHTNIASMEGACEAGRRATNVVLERTGSAAPRADVWPLEEPSFRALKWLDHQLFAAGRPHLFELLGIRQAVRAAAVIRRVERMLGLARIDDWADQYRLTAIVNGILTRLGVRDR
jgi:15-cis-phytoene desaturase